MRFNELSNQKAIDTFLEGAKNRDVIILCIIGHDEDTGALATTFIGGMSTFEKVKILRDMANHIERDLTSRN